MKKTLAVAAVVSSMGFAGGALAADFAFHGDLDHRFQVYTNHADFLAGDKFTKGGHVDVNDDADDAWGEVKYRLWAEMASDNKNVKGVYAIEVGGLEFGQKESVGKSKGGGYSGDGVNVETRWAYLDMQIPGVSDKMRLKTGLQPFNLNKYFWKETIMGVNLDGKAGSVGYLVGWERPYRVDAKHGNSDVSDVDAFVGKLSFDLADKSKIGLFASYISNDSAAIYDEETGARTWAKLDANKWEIKKLKDTVDLGIYTMGMTGKFNINTIFVGGDLIYQGGSIENTQYIDQDGVTSSAHDYDVSSFFARVEAGAKIGATKITGMYWYASGDDDPTDDEVNAYLATDVDMGASMVIMEGHPTSDDYFTERPYILDKGMHLLKLSVDSKVSDQTTIGGALLYMMTAEDITYTNDAGQRFSDDGIGTEIDMYVKYKLYPDVTLSFNAGYLLTDDAMDYFEQDLDGSADEDIYTIGARLRYKF
jgi:hypothetical protein